jgi:hypothetical protein
MDDGSEVLQLKELLRHDPEAVIRLFESQPSLYGNPSALSEYVKALVRVDRLDDSELLKTLQRGDCGQRGPSPPKKEKEKEKEKKIYIYIFYICCYFTEQGLHIIAMVFLQDVIPIVYRK